MSRRKHEGSLEPHPRVPLVEGVQLGNRRDNILWACQQSREWAMEVFDRTLPVDQMDLDRIAERVEYLADLIETLQTHGTISFHRRGCRCDWCEEAYDQFSARHNQAIRDRRLARVERNKREALQFAYDEEYDPL